VGNRGQNSSISSVAESNYFENRTSNFFTTRREGKRKTADILAEDTDARGGKGSLGGKRMTLTLSSEHYMTPEGYVQNEDGLRVSKRNGSPASKNQLARLIMKKREEGWPPIKSCFPYSGRRRIIYSAEGRESADTSNSSAIPFYRKDRAEGRGDEGLAKGGERRL